MITKEITTAQKILNNAVYKQNFTINIIDDSTTKNRYIVSSLNLYTGKNPSIEFDLITTISNTLNINKGLFNSIGGWLNRETNVYTLDANMHFNDIDFALKFAKVNKQIAIYDQQNNELIYLNN